MQGGGYMSEQVDTAGAVPESPSALTIHALAQSLVGMQVTANGSVPPPYREILTTLEATPRQYKNDVFQQELARLQMDARAINAAIAGMDPTAPPPVEPEPEAMQSCPPLPEAARLDPGLAWGAARWLDEYVAYASKVAPMTPRTFHESAALWLISVTTARRFYIPMDFGDVFPSLWICWIAGTSLWTKSTALSLASGMARSCMPWLLITGNTTPESLLCDLAGDQPKNWEQLSLDFQDEWRKARIFSSKRGMVMDEMSTLLSSFGRDYNASLADTFLKLYDCSPREERSTRSQGLVVVRNTYLPFLGASTPKAMSSYLSDGKYWGTGWWPRFALLTPDGSQPEYKESSNPGSPQPLITRLMKLYADLPITDWPDQPQPLEVVLEPDALAAWKRYDRAIRFDMVVSEALDDRLDGTYARLPTQLLKVATLCAAIDWTKGQPPRIELSHLARAEQIVEGWRASAHRVLAAASKTDYVDMRGRILKVVAKREPKGATLRDMYVSTSKTPEELQGVLRQMLAVGDVEAVPAPTGPKGGRPTARYRRSAGER